MNASHAIAPRGDGSDGVSRRRFEAVLFDLDGTLRANVPEGVEAFIDYARRAGLTLTPEQVILCERATHRYWADGAQVADHFARFDERGFWINYNRILLRAMGIDDCDDCAHRIQDYFDDYRPVDMLFPEAPRVLRALKEDGYVLGLVSNRDGDLAPLAAQYGIGEYFNFTLSGGQAGSFKPDSRIFRLALQMAGDVPPARALYIGDNYYADVLGATAVGMEALLIDPRDVFTDVYDKRVKRLDEVLDFVRAAR